MCVLNQSGFVLCLATAVVILLLVPDTWSRPVSPNDTTGLCKKDYVRDLAREICREKHLKLTLEYLRQSEKEMVRGYSDLSTYIRQDRSDHFLKKLHAFVSYCPSAHHLISSLIFDYC